MATLAALRTATMAADAGPAATPASAPAEATPTYLSGIITLADGATPVREAFVSVKGVGDESEDRIGGGQTDADGCFVIDHPLKPGTYEIRVAEDVNRTPLQQIVVPPNAGPIGIRLKLPAATLHGKVTDANGRPLADNLVMLSNRGKRLYYTVKTAADGGYSIAHILPGTYDLTANSTSVGRPEDMLYLRTKDLQIADADVTRDLVLKPRPRRTPSTTQTATTRPATSRPARAATKPATLSGTVTLADGVTPVTKSLVTGHPADGQTGLHTWISQTDGHGAFTVTSPLEPGTYRISVSQKNVYLPIQDFVILPNAAPPVVQFRLPAASLAGRVLDDEGRPVDDVTINLLGSDTRSGYQAITDANGNYRIEYILPGNYRTMANRQRVDRGGAMITWRADVVHIGTDAATQDFGKVTGPATAPTTRP